MDCEKGFRAGFTISKERGYLQNSPRKDDATNAVEEGRSTYLDDKQHNGLFGVKNGGIETFNDTALWWYSDGRGGRRDGGRHDGREVRRCSADVVVVRASRRQG